MKQRQDELGFRSQQYQPPPPPTPVQDLSFSSHLPSSRHAELSTSSSISSIPWAPCHSVTLLQHAGPVSLPSPGIQTRQCCLGPHPSCLSTPSSGTRGMALSFSCMLGEWLCSFSRLKGVLETCSGGYSLTQIQVSFKNSFLSVGTCCKP